MLILRRLALILILAMLVILVASVMVSRIRAPLQPRAHGITLVAVGDVMLDRGIARGIAAHGLGWPFGKVAHVIRSADLAFCNLECPFSVSGIKINKPICFKANPAYVKCLSDAGFNIVSNANNHSLDCGREGLMETIRALDKARVAHCGAGVDLRAASAPRIMNIGGLRVAFIGRNMWFPEGIWYRTDAPTVAELDESRIEGEIRAAKSKADVVIVSVHWGIEYRRQPEASQVTLGRRMIDAGASLVLGHHPHTTQPIERYHGGVIAYSLGNFLFDSPRRMRTDGMILRCRLSKSGVSDVRVTPVAIAAGRPVISGASDQ